MSRLSRFLVVLLLVLAGARLPASAAPARELPDFAELADRQGAAVVNISTTQAVRQARPGLPRLDEDDPMFDFFRRFVPRQPGSGPKVDPDNRSLGSGFIVSSDGYVLTNAHVVEGADEIIVKLSDKREFRARLMGADPRSDVALLKIEASGLPAVRIGDVGRQDLIATDQLSLDPIDLLAQDAEVMHEAHVGTRQRRADDARLKQGGQHAFVGNKTDAAGVEQTLQTIMIEHFTPDHAGVDQGHEAVDEHLAATVEEIGRAHV